MLKKDTTYRKQALGLLYSYGASWLRGEAIVRVLPVVRSQIGSDTVEFDLDSRLPLVDGPGHTPPGVRIVEITATEPEPIFLSEIAFLRRKGPNVYAALRDLARKPSHAGVEQFVRKFGPLVSLRRWLTDARPDESGRSFFALPIEQKDLDLPTVPHRCVQVDAFVAWAEARYERTRDPDCLMAAHYVRWAARMVATQPAGSNFLPEPYLLYVWVAETIRTIAEELDSSSLSEASQVWLASCLFNSQAPYITDEKYNMILAPTSLLAKIACGMLVRPSDPRIRPKTCAGCHRQFVPLTRTTKYCSRRCRAKHYKRMYRQQKNVGVEVNDGTR